MKKRALIVSALLLCITFALTTTAVAQYTEKTLYNFTGGSDGYLPLAGLIADGVGNLYGTTYEGGLDYCAVGCGNLFELSPVSGGGWSKTTLYNFTGEGGSSPFGALIWDASGNLYGTDFSGGAYGFGTVYKLSPSSSGWSLQVLYNFAGGTDGANPVGHLVFDPQGNLYGTTATGGNTGCTYGCGTAFELTPTQGLWQETQLHVFSGGSDGGRPYGGLIRDAGGKLYGTALDGGSSANCTGGCGTVFRFSPVSSGGWRFSRLYAFEGPKGAGPFGGLVFDAAGNLYGTTYEGGKLCPSGVGCGTVFELTPAAEGAPWRETLPHAFTGGYNGFSPQGGLVFDTAGNLYGITAGGGASNAGVVFELMPVSGGGWNFVRLYALTGVGDYYTDPEALLIDATGNLYGTTERGGTNSAGSIYKLSPPTVGRK